MYLSDLQRDGLYCSAGLRLLKVLSNLCISDRELNSVNIWMNPRLSPKTALQKLYTVINMLMYASFRLTQSVSMKTALGCMFLAMNIYVNA